MYNDVVWNMNLIKSENSEVFHVTVFISVTRGREGSWASVTSA